MLLTWRAIAPTAHRLTCNDEGDGIERYEKPMDKNLGLALSP